MRTLTTLITILFISLVSSPSWSETLTMDDLVERNGLHYKKFTDIPFNGAVTGTEIGKFKNGKRDGLSQNFYEDGKIRAKQFYKNNQPHGSYSAFRKDGSVRFILNYKTY